MEWMVHLGKRRSDGNGLAPLTVTVAMRSNAPKRYAAHRAGANQKRSGWFLRLSTRLPRSRGTEVRRHYLPRRTARDVVWDIGSSSARKSHSPYTVLYQRRRMTEVMTRGWRRHQVSPKPSQASDIHVLKLSRWASDRATDDKVHKERQLMPQPQRSVENTRDGRLHCREMIAYGYRARISDIGSPPPSLSRGTKRGMKIVLILSRTGRSKRSDFAFSQQSEPVNA